MASYYVDFSSTHNAGGYISGSATFKLRVYYSTSYNFNTNQTTVTLDSIYVSHTSGVLWGSCVFVGGIKVNGTYITKNSNQRGVAETYIGSGDGWCNVSPLYRDDVEYPSQSPVSVTVTGTTLTWQTVALRGSYCGCFYQTYKPLGVSEQSITKEAPPPYRASTITTSNVNIGSATTITINKDRPELVHTLQYKISGQSSYTTLVTKTSASTYTWTVPLSVYDYVGASSTSVAITFNCITYNGNTLIGSNTGAIVAYTVESECKPTISATHTFLNDQSSYTGDNTTGILNWSNVQIAVSATAKHGASISSYAIIHNGATSTSATTTYNKIQTGSWTYRATDSRGYISEGSILLTTIPYFEPSITMEVKSPNPTNNETKITCRGNWFNGSFGSVSNSLKVQYRYKTYGGDYGSWTTMTSSATNNTYTAPTTTILLDYRNKYVFQARVVDTLNRKTTAEQIVITLPIFDWGEHDFHFNVPIVLSADSYGSTLPQSGIEGQVFIKI